MITLLIFLSLACFRLTRLFTHDKITDWLRSWVVKQAPAGKVKTKVKQGVYCPFCFVSFTFSGLLCLYAVWTGAILWNEFPIWMPSVWGASVLWNQLFAALTRIAE